MNEIYLLWQEQRKVVEEYGNLLERMLELERSDINAYVWTCEHVDWLRPEVERYIWVNAYRALKSGTPVTWCFDNFNRRPAKKMLQFIRKNTHLSTLFRDAWEEVRDHVDDERSRHKRSVTEW